MRTRIFLSYKSEDSDLVRIVACWLRNNGIDFWFAEDAISLDAQFDDESINALIEDGVRSCTHAITFSSSPYWASHWCRLEVKHMRAQIRPMKHIVLERTSGSAEKRLSEFPDDVSHIEYDYIDSIGKFLTQIHNQMQALQWPVPGSLWTYLRFSRALRCTPRQLAAPVFSLNLPPDIRRLDLTHKPHAIVEYFCFDCDGPVYLTVTSSQYPTEAGLGGLDDWDMRRQSVELTKQYSDSLSRHRRMVSVDSIHTFVNCGKRHFGMTYSLIEMYNSAVPSQLDYAIGPSLLRQFLMRVGGQTNIPARKYTLVPQSNVEITLTFLVPGPMRRLWRLSTYMDAIACSLKRSDSQVDGIFGHKHIRDPLIDLARNGIFEKHPAEIREKFDATLYLMRTALLRPFVVVGATGGVLAGGAIGGWMGWKLGITLYERLVDENKLANDASLGIIGALFGAMFGSFAGGITSMLAAVICVHLCIGAIRSSLWGIRRIFGKETQNRPSWTIADDA